MGVLGGIHSAAVGALYKNFSIFAAGDMKSHEIQEELWVSSVF